MMRAYAYPPELARYVEAHWPKERTLTLTVGQLEEALSVCFQASLTTEEARPTRFRLLLTPATELPASGAPNNGVQRLRFVTTRPFTAEELRRLSPSTPFETALIGVHMENDKLRIWGIAHSGPAWLAPTWGGRSSVPNWSYDPIIHVAGPGRLAVRCAGKLVGGIERGVIVDAMMDVFDSRWLAELFAVEREQVRAEHAALQAQKEVPTLVEHALVGRVAQQMLRRAIQLVRGTRQGAMILVLDVEEAVAFEAGSELRGLRLKYAFEQEEPTRRYRTILFQILETLADTSSKAFVDWSDFVANDSAALERLEQAVFEMSRLIANLTAIDGAVVLDKRFRLVGFGADVSAELAQPTHVYRSLDTEGTKIELDDIENVGTRHRAAYRFVNDHPSGIALVVSQDGGVTFVANRDSKVVFWEHTVSP